MHWQLPQFQLKGWAVSIAAFFVIVLLAHPPSSDITVTPASISDSLSKENGETNSQGPFIHPGKATGDVLVECLLVTPRMNSDSTAGSNALPGKLQITVHRTIAPLASDAFLDMVSLHHFDGNFLFRVLPGFIAQWGIESPNSDGGTRTKTKFPKVDIDPPPPTFDPRRSNVRGTLNFAGGNSSSGQVYVNKSDNRRLDKEKGSLPFATLDDKSMAIVDSVYDGYKEGMGQVKAVNAGENEVKSLFPRMSHIERCWIGSH